MHIELNGQLEGEFEGWSGDTIFEFTNGQIWRQCEYSYSYSYAYRPGAKIWNKSGDYFLEVDGMKQMIRCSSY